LFDNGFARVKCTRCPAEYLVAFSCKGRGLCPSCGAKRAALFSELLQHKILPDVPHAQWVLSLPKMLRPYFLHHRELLGELARLVYGTVREMMAAAVDDPNARPGMVAVIQTFGSSPKEELGFVCINVGDGLPTAVGIENATRDDGMDVRVPLQSQSPSSPARPRPHHPRAHRTSPLMASGSPQRRCSMVLRFLRLTATFSKSNR